MNFNFLNSKNIQVNISKDQEIESISNEILPSESFNSSIENNKKHSKIFSTNNINNINLNESVNIENINVKKIRQPSFNYISNIKKDKKDLKSLSESLASNFSSNKEDEYSDSSSFSMSSSSSNSSIKKTNSFYLSHPSINMQKPKEIYNKIMMAEQEGESTYEINEIFAKLETSEWTTSFFTITTIVISLVYHDIYTNIKKDYNKEPELNKDFLDCILIINSISIFCFNFASVLRYIIQIKLHKSMNKITKRTTFFNCKYFSSFLYEAILSLFHPNIFTKDITIKTKKNWFKVECEYDLNDVLTFICLFRIYVIFRWFIFLTEIYTSRANRLSHLIGTELTRGFALRSFILDSPFSFLLLYGTTTILFLSFMLKISEGPYYTSDMGINDYRKIKNCIWNVFVTMTTVGYGDMYPSTVLGKIIILVCCLVGVFITSLVTISIQNIVTMNKYEENSFNLRHDEILEGKNQRNAANFFIKSIKYYIANKNYNHRRKNDTDDKNKKKLKGEFEESLYNKIASEKKFEEFARFCRNTYQAVNEKELLNEKMDEFQGDLNDINDLNGEIKNNIENLYNIVFDKK